MKNKMYTLNTMLADVLCLLLLAFVLVRTFLPHFIIPELDVPNMVAISLLALIADHYLAPGAKRCYICIAGLGAITFGLLPFAACFVGAMDALKLGITGGIVFTVTTFVFTDMAERLSSGPAAKAAPWLSAFGLYLAVQALMGMF
ncbi:MAG: hypothetical protein IJ960_02850 [Oscillospiraceae bacterium]|nr:hypothetical protein [Oscillospiraceae bacterium]